MTNIEARAVNTVAWLSDPRLIFAVPVYQRHYRWSIDRCRQLLADIRQVADGDDHSSHFIGSFLAVATPGDVDELVMIDGQQRLATLTLLAAALDRVMRPINPSVSAELRTTIEHPTRSGETKLRPHRDGTSVLPGLVFGRSVPAADLDASRYDENLEFFLGEVAADPDRVWRGLQRLEHVAVTLGVNADAQQIFESLNTTAEPLRDHELIHNHLLMGRPYDEQLHLEETVWEPIECNTGDYIEQFLRDYLILVTERDDRFVGEHGIYRVFKAAFDGNTDALRTHSDAYRILLEPELAGDDAVARHLRYVSTFGAATYPLLLATYSRLDCSQMVELLELLQSLYLRKMIVGESREGLAARLCRVWGRSGDATRVMAEVVRRTPSDERVAASLRYGSVPHVGYVLGRIQGVDSLAGMEIEHIFPQSPSLAWRGGEGHPEWAGLDEAEQARHRQVLNTLGNFTLLEQPLNAGASNNPFDQKKRYYLDSAVAETRGLAVLAVWNADAIIARTAALTDEVLRIWARPTDRYSVSPGELVPILDVPRHLGYYPGWKTEYEYVVFHGQTWEVRNNTELLSRVFHELWDHDVDRVLAWHHKHKGPIDPSALHSRYERLDIDHYLNLAMFPQWSLKAVQDVLDDLELADGVSVMFSTDAESQAETDSATV